MPALINPMAIPLCSFYNLDVSYFPSVWIHTMYKFYITQFILSKSTVFSSKK